MNPDYLGYASSSNPIERYLATAMDERADEPSRLAAGKVLKKVLKEIQAQAPPPLTGRLTREAHKEYKKQLKIFERAQKELTQAIEETKELEESDFFGGDTALAPIKSAFSWAANLFRSSPPASTQPEITEDIIDNYLQHLHDKIYRVSSRAIESAPSAAAPPASTTPSLRERVSAAGTAAASAATVAVRSASQAVFSKMEHLTPRNIAPYIIAIAAQYNLPDSTLADVTKLAAACAILSYSLGQWITTQAPDQNAVAKVLERAACAWALMQAHIMSYKAASGGAEGVLTPLQQQNLISEETQRGLALLSGIMATGVVIPSLMLRGARLMSQHQSQREQAEGLGTQRSAIAALPQGSTPEVSTALQTYDFFNQQLSNPTAVFQYGLVALNALRDQGSAMRKMRNVWLLAAVTLSDLSKHLARETVNLSEDARINAMTYTVVRDGQTIENVRRDALKVGDLVRLSDAVQTVHDEKSGETRSRALLSGYLMQRAGEDPLQPVISLVELNGESKPLILAPPRQEKTTAECKPLELGQVQNTAAIFPGTLFLSLDNSGKEVTPDQLYLQIAAAPVSSQSHPEKTAFSTQQTAGLQARLIGGVLAASLLATVALTPFSTEAEGSLAAVAYATGLVDSFTQAFGQLQTLIPLTAPVMTSMINQTLTAELNAKLDGRPISVNNALLVADMFDFLKKGLVRIYSDKTGTVTETRMVMRGFEGIPEHDERVVSAFATTYSAQKTEEEENEIRRYYREKGIKIESEMVAGDSNSLMKTISRDGKDPITFKSTRVGLFTDFGGQFTIRQEIGKPPVLIFCGVPKEADAGDRFKGTPLMDAYNNYARKASLPENQAARQDSLTRDWCIAEAELTPENHQALLKALAMEDPNAAKQALKEVIHAVKGNFKYLGTFQIDNPIKPGAREAIRQWNTQGIGFMMITGDTRNAAKMIAKKLYPDRSEGVYEAGTLPQGFETQDLSKSTVVLSDTTPETLALLDQLEGMGAKRPNVIFSQMKESDKGRLVEHAKAKGLFIIANGDGSNDLQMLHAAHVAIGDAALDGSFARGVHEASNLTDSQVRQLMGTTAGSFYELFDIHTGEESRFLKMFTRMANTQPKVVTALLVKSLKSLALTSAIGWNTQEMKGQFPMMLGYDAAFLASLRHITLSTADTRLFDRPLGESHIPYTTLAGSMAVAGAQSFYHYFFSDHQITSIPTLLINLTASVAAMRVALGPPLLASATPSTMEVVEE